MTTNTIQDKLSFFAMAGTRDIIYENRMVKHTRRSKSRSGVTDKKQDDKGLVVNHSIQLSLF
jgi:hypothetical protein